MGASGVHRELRVPLGAVDDATARQLLATHRRLVLGVVRRFLPVAQRAFHPIGPDELLAIGETAVLEAHLTYRPGDETKVSSPEVGLRLWTRRVVRWRIADAVSRAVVTEPPAETRAEEPLHAKLNGHEQQTHVYRSELLIWLKGAIGRLPIRQRIVVASLLRGETQAELASQLGLSPGRVCQLYREALETLRADGDARGFDSVDLDA